MKNDHNTREATARRDDAKILNSMDHRLWLPKEIARRSGLPVGLVKSRTSHLVRSGQLEIKKCAPHVYGYRKAPEPAEDGQDKPGYHYREKE